MQQLQAGFNTTLMLRNCVTETEFFSWSRNGLQNSVSLCALHFPYKPNMNMDKLHEVSENNSVILYFPQAW